MIRKSRARIVVDEAPSFGSVWRWITGIMAAVVAAGSLSAIGWALSLRDDLTKLAAAVESNAHTLQTLAERSAKLEADRSLTAAAIVELRATINHMQSVQATSNAALSERIRDIEREQKWRDRMTRPSSK